MAVLGHGYISRHVLEFHSFELILGSSCVEVIWEKLLLKIVQNLQGNTCARGSLLRKLQDAWKFSEILMNFQKKKTNILLKAIATVNQNSGKPRRVLIPFMWYGRPKKICPNNISSTFLRNSFSTFITF